MLLIWKLLCNSKYILYLIMIVRLMNNDQTADQTDSQLSGGYFLVWE